MIGSVNSSCCLEKILGFVWFGEWKSGRIENGERIEKWKDRKDLVFSLYVFGWESRKVEGWKTLLFG